MKKVIVVSGLLVIVWFIYHTTSGGNGQIPPNELVVVEPVKTNTKQSPENEQDLKRQQMADKFVDLKAIRKKISMRLSRLSSRLRRSEFPPEEAKTISQDMRRAGYLLKNPKLLGAFSDPTEIEDEIEQLSDINVKLDEIKKSLDEKRKNKP